MAVSCQSVFSYAQMTKVMMNGAEVWVKVVKETQWRWSRCSKCQGAGVALPCGLEPGYAACRLFSICVTGPLHHPQQSRSPLCFPVSCPHLIQLYCEPPEPHRDHIKSTSSGLSDARWLSGERAGGSSSRQRWGEAASPSLLGEHQPRVHWHEMLCPEPKQMHGWERPVAGAEPCLCPQGGKRWLAACAAHIHHVNPLLSDFQIEERCGPEAETHCRLAVLGTGSHPSQGTIIAWHNSSQCCWHSDT